MTDLQGGGSRRPSLAELIPDWPTLHPFHRTEVVFISLNVEFNVNRHVLYRDRSINYTLSLHFIYLSSLPLCLYFCLCLFLLLFYYFYLSLLIFTTLVVVEFLLYFTSSSSSFSSYHYYLSSFRWKLKWNFDFTFQIFMIFF